MEATTATGQVLVEVDNSHGVIDIAVQDKSNSYLRAYVLKLSAYVLPFLCAHVCVSRLRLGIPITVALIMVVLGCQIKATRVFRRRAIRRASDDIECTRSSDCVAMVRVFLARLRMKRMTPAAVYQLADHLYCTGHVGAVVRIHTGDAPAIPTPIGTPFEPRLLNEEEPTTMEMLEWNDALYKSATNAGSETERIVIKGRFGALVRRWRNNNSLLAIACGLVLSVIVLFLAWVFRSPWALALAFIQCSETFKDLFVPRRHLFRGDKWYLVPGGLVSRANRELRSPTCVFDRQSSVLVICPSVPRSRLWTVWVRNNEFHNVRMLSPDEVTLLLRAWLSPLRAPGSERISDLM